MTGTALILALVAMAEAAEPPVEPPIDARPPVDAAETVSLFTALCLDGLPDLAGTEARLTESGFPPRNVAGLSEHPDKALSVIVNANAELENVGAGCMVAAYGPDYEALLTALQTEISARKGFVGGPVLNVEAATGQPFWAARRDDTHVVAGRTPEQSVFVGVSILPEWAQ